MNKQISLLVTPLVSHGDEPFTVLVSGLAPEQAYTLTVTTKDDDNKAWQAWGLFQSDKNGTIDLSQQAPAQGTYSVADPTALLWSMRPAGEENKPIPMFTKNSCAPLVVTLTLSAEGKALDSVSLTRLYLSPKIRRLCTDDEAVAGTLFLPEGSGPFPLIICLSGSGGGITEPRATLLAGHGYAVFALAYFGLGTLPKSLNLIPLEFFEKGVAWAKAHAPIDPNKIGVFGISKGGELALLLGSQYPEIKAVAAFSGSAYVWQGIGFGQPESSWTKSNTPLSFITMKMPLSTIINLIFQKPAAFREAYLRGLNAAKNKAEAMIPIEKCQGPILLAAGSADQVWPAVDFADQIVARLKEHNFPYPFEYLREEGAGHLVCLPYLPSAEIMNGLVFCSTSTAQNPLASIKSWQSLVAFFGKYLRVGFSR